MVYRLVEELCTVLLFCCVVPMRPFFALREVRRRVLCCSQKGWTKDYSGSSRVLTRLRLLERMRCCFGLLLR
jgi:hypothetical protein